MPFDTIKQDNLTASTRTANLLAGRILEFLPYDANVTIYAISSAAGIKLDVFADTDQVITNSEIVSIGTTLNYNDNILTSFDAAAGSRISIFATETAAAATTDILIGYEVNPL